MPSSAGPNDYVRTPQRFHYRGVCLQPQDALPEGKHAFGLNIRSHIEGTWEPRYGFSIITEDAIVADTPIHSIFRLNDTSAFATGGSDEMRFLGLGVDLYAGDAGGSSYALLDTGYSGNPLSAVAAAPFASPRPYLYVADRDRMRKFDADLADFSIGIPQPTVPPTALLAAVETTFLNSIDAALWSGYADVVPPGPAATPIVARLATVTTHVLYDSGVTGMASIAVADFDNLTPGATVDGGPSPETVIVQEVLPPVSPTTIAAIIYDEAGGTGFCTIQPTGSFSAGLIELPLPAQLDRRYKDLGADAPLPVTINRTVDFPVNALVLLGGVEVVRILSIAVGPDGVQSFRAFTAGSFAATDTITGVGSFRAYTTTTWAPGQAVDANALEFTMQPPNDTDTIIGGVQSPISGGSRNWNSVGARATQPEDIIRFGIRVSELGWVKSVRLVLDVSPVGPAFLRDYYFYEWRAADLVTAIQATSEAVTGYVTDAQKAAVAQGQFDDIYGDQFGQGGSRPVSLPANADLAITRDTSDASATDLDQAKGWRTTNQAPKARLAPVSAGGAISRQLGLGNDAWITLECRVGDLTRIGMDPTLTLGAIGNALISLQMAGTADVITVNVSDVYLTGGYGPDVAQTLPPYVYRYSYRSTVTGERTNLSPPMRAGMFPHRGRVQLTAQQSAAAQCDVVDFWRFGGTLARWAYVGTAPNDAVVTYDDDMADRRIDGGEKPRMDLYQPWPTSDLPRSGIANVAGTAVELISGDNFDPSWAADSLIIVNGIATQLYQSPEDPDLLHVIDNCGSGLSVPWSMPSPTILATPLQGLWGGPIAGTWFHFACGDPNDPGALHWTNGNDPDASADRNYLVVTSASEPLQNGYFDGGMPYVASTEKIYGIIPTPGDVTDFRCRETGSNRGFWTPWCFAVAPWGGVYFLAKDGIYYSVNGSAAKPITLPDLQPLFPQEGTTPEAIRNLYPVDMTATTFLKLTIVGQYLYFDYLDTNGEYRALVYEPLYERWTPDVYAVGASARLGEPGPQVLNHMIGGVDGRLHQYDSTKITDGETDFNWALWTPWANGQDARNYKQWGDAILDFNPAGSEAGITVTPVVDNGNVALDPRVLGAGETLRDTYIVEVGASGEQGYGVWSRNFGLWIEGTMQLCDVQRPLFYLWEPSFLNKGTSVARRATDWEDLAYKGAKFVQGVIIRANTFGENKSIVVQYDGPNAAPQTGITLTINHDGEQTKAYPLSSAGWTPFIAELVRLQGADDVEWSLLDWRFIWEPAPELATQWETQYTTFDYPGFLAVFDGVVAYQSTAAITWTVEYQDGAIDTYTLADSGGAYRRIRQICSASKGKAVRFKWTSDEPFRLFKRDCTVRVQPWGAGGGYQIQQPFGGPSRIDGAEI